MKQFSRFIPILLIVILVALSLTAAVIAQDDETPEATMEATVVVTPAPEVTPEVTEEPPFVIVYPGAPGQPDLTPVIDEYAVREAIYRSSVGIIAGLLSVAIIAALKYVLPGRQIDTKSIYTLVIGGFTLLYAGAEALNMTEQLQGSTDILTSMAGPIWSLAMTIWTGQKYFGSLKKTNTPLLTEKQGDGWFEFKKTRADEIETGGRNLVSG